MSLPRKLPAFPRLFILLLLGAFALSAGSPESALARKKKAEAVDETRDEAERLFDKASRSYKKGYYDDALRDFEKLRNTYPFSKFAVEAELMIADGLYKKREYIEAADAYRTFAKLHPRHEKVDYAAYRVGLALFKDAPKSPDRDQSSVTQAMQEFRSFLVTYPDSKFADEAAKHVGEGRDRLAAKEMYVARFYLKRKKWLAARGRLEEVVERYPDASEIAEATYLLGLAQFRTRQNDEAGETLTGYLERYPGGKFARDARKLLGRMGVGLPEPGSESASDESS